MGIYMPKALDLLGKVFTRLTVVSKAPKHNNSIYWNCLCVCGKEVRVRGGNLTNGTTKSCGCYKNDMFALLDKAANITHGLTRKGQVQQSYRSWQAMMTRCYKTEGVRFEDWGGRGITVCERWHSYVNFLEDMGEPPTKGLSIERKENSEGYSPENCYWATATQQGRNKRNNHILEYHGEKKCLSEWAELMGINFKTLHNRITMKWSVEKAFETPVRGY